MVHGQFLIYRKSELVQIVPNQFTIAGMQQVLQSAFWGFPSNWMIGLCAHNPSDVVALSAVREPTIGTNGYARQSLPMNVANWPTIGVLNGETFIRSREFTFTASGDYDEQTNRLFITDGNYVIAISSAFEAGLTTIDSDLTTYYELWFK